MGPRPKGEGGRRRRIGPGLAHNATRVVICRRWVITSLRLRLRRAIRRETRGEDGARSSRDRGSPLEKARPADLIREPQPSKHPRRTPRYPPFLPWALVISARHGRRSPRDASQNGRSRCIPDDTRTGPGSSFRIHLARCRVTIFARL